MKTVYSYSALSWQKCFLIECCVRHYWFLQSKRLLSSDEWHRRTDASKDRWWRTKRKDEERDTEIERKRTGGMKSEIWVRGLNENVPSPWWAMLGLRLNRSKRSSIKGLISVCRHGQTTVRPNHKLSTYKYIKTVYFHVVYFKRQSLACQKRPLMYRITGNDLTCSWVRFIPGAEALRGQFEVGCAFKTHWKQFIKRHGGFWSHAANGTGCFSCLWSKDLGWHRPLWRGSWSEVRSARVCVGDTAASWRSSEWLAATPRQPWTLRRTSRQRLSAEEEGREMSNDHMII